MIVIVKKMTTIAMKIKKAIMTDAKKATGRILKVTKSATLVAKVF